MFPSILFVWIWEASNLKPFFPKEWGFLPKEQIMNHGALDRSHLKSFLTKWDGDYNNFPLDFGGFIEQEVCIL